MNGISSTRLRASSSTIQSSYLCTKIRNEQRKFALIFSIHNCTGYPNWYNGARKRNKRQRPKKKRKQQNCHYLQTIRSSTERIQKALLDFKGKFNRVTQHTFSYTLAIKIAKWKIFNTFVIASKNKILRNKFNKRCERPEHWKWQKVAKRNKIKTK